MLSYDMRGHGGSVISPPCKENDFDVNTLAMDAVQVLCAEFPEKLPSIVLVGHR